jgi:thymidylate synthase ThyX
MHKIQSYPITRESFEMDDYDDDFEISEHYHFSDFVNIELISTLERLRQKYNETKDKRYWKELVRWLPNGWLQTRTVTMNYENLRNMYHQRDHHKLTEWHSYCDWVKTLPYAQEFIID